MLSINQCALPATMLLISHLCILVSLASSSASNNGLITQEAAPYKLTPEEFRAFLSLRSRQKGGNITTDYGHEHHSDSRSHDGLSNSLAEFTPYYHYPNSINLCRTHDSIDEHGFPVRFTWRSAGCISTRPRSFSLICHESRALPPHHNIWGRVGYHVFTHTCPDSMECVNWSIRRYDGTFHKDVYCVGYEVKKTDEMVGVALNPRIHGPEVHCTPQTDIPGTRDYIPTNEQSDMILTEELSWANGSEYKSPFLFIYDTTTNFKFDRIIREDSSIVSTSLEVVPTRGRIPQRKMQFCAKLAHRTDVWVVMTYAWFVLSRPGSRIITAEPSADSTTDSTSNGSAVDTGTA